MAESKVPIFRLVNGELTRVPGDIQDPRRRYTHVVNAQTDESYIREYTDDEERQADAEAARWEAERPQREAEEERRKKEAEQFRDSLKYEHRVVAFLDIMGWASAIDASTRSAELTQKLGIAIQGLNIQVEMNARLREHGWPGDPILTQFSDSLLLSFAADRHAKSGLEQMLSTIILNLMFNGFVVRGAVTNGLMIHRETLAYGPAMVAAYKLEQEIAVEPRIILSPTLAKAWSVGMPLYDKKGQLLGHHKCWRQDEDGVYFLDHLSNSMGMIYHDGENQPRAFNGFMVNWRSLIVQRIEENRSNPSVVRKYVWLARYFNQVCTENPTWPTEKINLSALLQP